MSVERPLRVRIGPHLDPRLRELEESAAACLRRYDASAVGDEAEIVRYQHIRAELERLAYRELFRQQLKVSDVPDSSESVAVELLSPFGIEEPAPCAAAYAGRIPPRQVFRPRSARTSAEVSFTQNAVRERFERQLDAWLGGRSDPEPICPSDIPNRALSEALRRYAEADGNGPVWAAVRYRDGSTARPFPLGSLPMDDCSPLPGTRTLRLTLMSIRHVTLDKLVDGAWLRNREISVNRPTADTDELVYLQSREQFSRLTRHEPIVIELLQTGLEPANVGFYRALVDHHLEHAGHHVTVLPRYYEGQDESLDDFAKGTIWQVSES